MTDVFCIQVQWDRQCSTSTDGRFQTQSSNSQSGADHPTPETQQPWHVRQGDPTSAAAGASVWQWKPSQHQLHKQVPRVLLFTWTCWNAFEWVLLSLQDHQEALPISVGQIWCVLFPFFLFQLYCMHSLPVADPWPLVSPEAMGSVYSSGSTCSISGILGIAKCSCRGKDIHFHLLRYT